MNQHKTTPVSDSDGTWVIRRRRGNRVRYQNTLTAAWDRWTLAPRTESTPATDAHRAALAASLNEAAAKIDAQQRTQVTAAAYESMTVPALRKILSDTYNLKPTTRTKKDALVHTLVELSTHK